MKALFRIYLPCLVQAFVERSVQCLHPKISLLSYHIIFISLERTVSSCSCKVLTFPRFLILP